MSGSYRQMQVQGWINRDTSIKLRKNIVRHHVEPGCRCTGRKVCPLHVAEYETEWKPRRWSIPEYISMRLIAPHDDGIDGESRDRYNNLSSALLKLYPPEPTPEIIALDAPEASRWRDALRLVVSPQLRMTRVSQLIWLGVELTEVISFLDQKKRWHEDRGRSYLSDERDLLTIDVYAWMLGSRRDMQMIPNTSGIRNAIWELVNRGLGDLGIEDDQSGWTVGLSFMELHQLVRYRNAGLDYDEAIRWHNTVGPEIADVEEWVAESDGSVDRAMEWIDKLKRCLLDPTLDNKRRFDTLFGEDSYGAAAISSQVSESDRSTLPRGMDGAPRILKDALDAEGITVDSVITVTELIPRQAITSEGRVVGISSELYRDNADTYLDAVTRLVSMAHRVVEEVPLTDFRGWVELAARSQMGSLPQSEADSIDVIDDVDALITDWVLPWVRQGLTLEVARSWHLGER